ncbi:MAG: hypothetical protein V7K67_11085 [Nostoc sp.]
MQYLQGGKCDRPRESSMHISGNEYRDVAVLRLYKGYGRMALS